MSNLWSICLASNKGRKIVQLSPAASIRELHQLAETHFATPISSLKYGFPPKIADHHHDGTQPIQEIFQNQERIQVEFGTLAQPTTIPSSTSISSSSSSPSSTLRKSQRAAAKRATEKMPAVIQAQEELLKEQQQQQPRKRPKTTTLSTTKPQNKKIPIPKLPSGTGRRLVDGATVTTGSSRKRPVTLGGKPKSNDMSEALLGALNDSGKMGQVLRKGMRNAVQASYETTKAFSRLAAIQAQSYTMEVHDSLLTIVYHGSVDKTQTIQEEVDCIPRDVLEAVLQNIHASNEEALRPENLALLSPRVLWSLVRIFPNHSSMQDMYKELLPDLQWSFLRRRAQQLSEKALENLRQQQQDDEDDGGKALEVIAAVEHAMEHLQDYTATERQARLAQAAVRRLQATNPKTESSRIWKLMTPTEPDREELRECIQGTTTKSETTKLINKLLRECQIHNWRELANVDDAEPLAQKLQVPVEQVQSWIDRAQDESVDEIIVEICDDNVRVVELLTEKARSSTPKDLAMWRSIPQLLYQRIGGVMEDTPTIEQLRTWSQRSHQVLQEYEWLNWYATPVE